MPGKFHKCKIRKSASSSELYSASAYASDSSESVDFGNSSASEKGSSHSSDSKGSKHSKGSSHSSESNEMSKLFYNFCCQIFLIRYIIYCCELFPFKLVFLYPYKCNWYSGLLWMQSFIFITTTTLERLPGAVKDQLLTIILNIWPFLTSQWGRTSKTTLPENRAHLHTDTKRPHNNNRNS